MAIRACRTSSTAFGSWASASAKNSPSIEKSRMANDLLAARADFDGTDGGQRAQRLAHERSADAQRDRKFALGEQTITRLQLAGDQLVADEADHQRS